MHSSTSTSTSTLCTRARARAREQESTRAREHESTKTSTQSSSTRWPGHQCESSGERHAKPFGHVFNHVGLHVHGWLYVLGMLPRGYLPVFATLNPQSTCHVPRPGPTLAPWCSGGLPACPGAESTRKDPRPQEKKMPMCKQNTIDSNASTIST